MTIDEVVAAARRNPPMVHCLTATVSMSLVADGLLAAGLRPMMTETLEEAPVVVTAADALSVNLGTLSTDGMVGIPATVAARPDGVPWVLDPTAIGLAPVRTRMARDFLDEGPDVVKGNASEILALVGGRGGRGADSADAPEHAVDTTDGVAEKISRGHPFMARVTGTGCLLGALTAGCLVATDDPVQAAVTAVTWFDVAGEVAAARAGGPGTFRVQLLDALDEVARTGVEETR